MAAAVANLFAGNPLATAVGHKIEQATDSSLASEDWGLNMEICDMVNSSEEACKDAARAIRKRLHSLAGKNFTGVMYTLTVLETCVKNCGRPFHALVCQKDYIQDLIKLIGPRFEPPLAVQEKTLALVQSWAHTFRGQPDLSGAAAVYDELLAKGVQFPDGGDTPILTPGRSAPPPAQAPPPAAVTTPTPAPPTSAPTVPTSRAISLTERQAEKLRQETHVVDGNLQVLNEMLSALKPTSAAADDLQLLQHLASTCRTMQKRLVALVGRVSDDKITAELLRLNDELNNAFIRYERFERGRTGSATSPVTGVSSPSAAAAAAAAAAAVAPSTADASLIDLEDTTDAATQQFAGLGVSGAGGSAQSQRIPPAGAAPLTPAPHTGFSTVDSAGPAGTAGAADSMLQQETDFDEMEQWLNSAGSAGGAEGGARPTEGVLTSSEFDRFLAERAAAADAPPQPQPQQKQ